MSCPYPEYEKYPDPYTISDSEATKIYFDIQEELNMLRMYDSMSQHYNNNYSYCQGGDATGKYEYLKKIQPLYYRESKLDASRTKMFEGNVVKSEPDVKKFTSKLEQLVKDFPRLPDIETIKEGLKIATLSDNDITIFKKFGELQKTIQKEFVVVIPDEITDLFIQIQNLHSELNKKLESYILEYYQHLYTTQQTTILDTETFLQDSETKIQSFENSENKSDELLLKQEEELLKTISDYINKISTIKKHNSQELENLPKLDQILKRSSLLLNNQFVLLTFSDVRKIGGQLNSQESIFDELLQKLNNSKFKLSQIKTPPNQPTKTSQEPPSQNIPQKNPNLENANVTFSTEQLARQLTRDEFDKYVSYVTGLKDAANAFGKLHYNTFIGQLNELEKNTLKKLQPLHVENIFQLINNNAKQTTKMNIKALKEELLSYCV